MIPRGAIANDSLRMLRDGYHYGLGLGAAGALAGLWLSVWAAAPWFMAAAFCLYFFRDPNREIPPGPVCVAPADGRVVRIREEPGDRVRVSIFLNIFDVHVNRSPVAGTIASVRYSPGRFRLAHLDVASAENERNKLVIESRLCRSPVEVTQIAGLLARRIVCHKSAGETLRAGERFGLIKFGSRVDVVLGPEWDLAVAERDRVLGGASILARRS